MYLITFFLQIENVANISNSIKRCSMEYDEKSSNEGDDHSLVT